MAWPKTPLQSEQRIYSPKQRIHAANERQRQQDLAELA
jgi:hypothetical protein